MKNNRKDTNASPLLSGSCACGASTFKANVVPKERFICHCLYCQAFVKKSYTDVTIFKASDVELTNEKYVVYDNPRSLPKELIRNDLFGWGNPARGRFRKCASLDRGLCTKCGTPYVEKIGTGPVKFIFIPTINFENKTSLPPVSRHTFYNLRVDDIDDKTPKLNNYATSQWGIIKMVTKVLF